MSVNGLVDRAGRALISLRIRATGAAEPVELTAWVDTAFTGELLIPRSTIEQLRLPQSSAVMAGLADGNEVVLETFSCLVEWFDEVRQVEVVESEAMFPLVGVGLLRFHKLEIDYRLGVLTIA
jgi:clan AA aspartic protease